MQYVKFGVYEKYALALIISGTLLRVLIAALKWPLLNSDEGTMGIMALHIAYHGEHPIFYYGQHYMGTLEAYHWCWTISSIWAIDFHPALWHYSALHPFHTRYVLLDKYRSTQKVWLWGHWFY